MKTEETSQEGQLNRRKIEFVLCHHDPDRSFHLLGRQFPLCARCTGILVGYLTFPIFHFNIIHPSLLLIILLMIPLIIDSSTQTMGYRESNNMLRFFTGFLAGSAQVALIVLIGKVAVGYIKGVFI